MTILPGPLCVTRRRSTLNIAFNKQGRSIPPDLLSFVGGGMSIGSSELCIRIVHHGSRTSIAVEGELDFSNRSVLQTGQTAE